MIVQNEPLFSVEFAEKGATLSDDEVYRYDLTRRWRAGDDWVVWVMLNPSTADAMTDDQTIRQCVSFSKRWGWGGLAVVNLYAWRATDPRALIGAADPVGIVNHKSLEYWIAGASLVVAAWGATKIVPFADPTRTTEHEQRYVRLLCEHYGKSVHCLGVTKGGFPRHPSRLAHVTPLELFEWPHS